MRQHSCILIVTKAAKTTQVLFRFLCLCFMTNMSLASHTSNHAVIVGSSRYWFNYRHEVNALSIYTLLKDNGFRDENIVLMLADEYAINPRNVLKNVMYPGNRKRSLYDKTTEIDYRGEDVTVQNLVLALTGRQRKGLAQLQSDRDSHILIYLTGHGGDQFFKFQDVEELLATEIASTLDQMHRDGLYGQVLLVADTCQAFTLGDKITAPNVTVIGSSLRDESSYAHHSDMEIGLASIERYTHTFMEYVRANGTSHSLQQSMVDAYPFLVQRAHIGARDDLSPRKLSQVPLSDFFVAREKAQKPLSPSLRILEEFENTPTVPLRPPPFLFGSEDPVLEQMQQPEMSDHAYIEGQLEPSDPFFLFSVALTLIAFSWASLRW